MLRGILVVFKVFRGRATVGAKGVGLSKMAHVLRSSLGKAPETCPSNCGNFHPNQWLDIVIICILNECGCEALKHTCHSPYCM